jgi:Rap1a immunity proteins
MAIKVSAFLTTVCLLFAAEARAISGNEWRRLPKLAQSSYVAGVVDTWNSLVQASFDAQQQSPVITVLTKVTACATGMEYDQIHAIVQKYIETHPAVWHENMATLVWSAFNEVCAATGK